MFLETERAHVFKKKQRGEVMHKTFMLLVVNVVFALPGLLELLL